MVIKIDNDVKSTSKKYVLNRKAGRSIIERRPIFSPDGKSVLIIVENIVRVYNLQTTDWCRSLETETPVNNIIGIVFLEDEDYNLYGCSDSGYVTAWTWENGVVLRETKLQISANMEALSFDMVDSTRCFVVSGNSAVQFLHLGLYSVKTGELLQEYPETFPIYNDFISVAIGLYKDEPFVSIVNGSDLVYVQNIIQPHIKACFSVGPFRLLCVAGNKQGWVAVGDALGKATIIRGDLYEPKNQAKEVVHWHFLPLLAVCFTNSGSYLISGGMEKVLVKWTLGHLANKAGEKNFIPRLPGHVRFISVNDTHIAITLSNNSVVIASMPMRVVSTILECGGLSTTTRAFGTPLVYDSRSKCLIVPGRTGFLQLYSTSVDKVLYNIDITEKNNIPSERQNLLPLETEVTCVAVSGNGAWLVTSEYRNDGVNYPEENLKFWAADTNTTPYRLNTCVNLSHGGCNVLSIALNNKGEFCVTSGTDEKFRIWAQHHSLDRNKKKVSWKCLTACYYSSGVAPFLADPILNNFKHGQILGLGNSVPEAYLREDHKENDVIRKILNVHKVKSACSDKGIETKKVEGVCALGGVAISQDGSLIAAWFGCKLTLWDTHACHMRTTLSHPALRPSGRHVRFGNKDAAHYLVCTTESCLAVWSLLSLTVTWLVQIRPMCLTAHLFSNKMAVVTEQNDVFVFTPHTSKPLLVQKGVIDPTSGVVQQCVFGAATRDEIRLYLMRNDSEIYCLEPESTSENKLEVIKERNIPASNFSSLLAEVNLSEVKSASSPSIQQLNMSAIGNSAISQFLSGAPHMIPPISMLCTSFLQHLSGFEEQEEPQEREDNVMEVDSSSDDEEQTPKLAHVPKPEQLCKPDYEKIKEKKLKKLLNRDILNVDTTSTIFTL
ncbi:unnamed protein product [Leptidea sinapis]|uniref:WD repeat-containing protein 75 second beta-propeller domain-containing protein n=1 Tax=Leptidea sinapis TaxID=189913 RepID=A0A5E4PTM3_9NEOP|nr:unnamed protein product [Leptidea sinapis]